MKYDWKTPYELEAKVAAIIAKQAHDGWYFDVPLANEYITFLEGELTRLYDLIRPHFKPTIRVPYNQPIAKPFLKSGLYNRYVIDWMQDKVDTVGGPFTRVLFEEPNLESPEIIKNNLLSLGWKPTEFNYKKDKFGKVILNEQKKPIVTSAKLTEDSYDSLSTPIGKEIAKYLVYSHRLSSIKGLLSNVRSDNTISASANTIGTPTGRMRHEIVVNIPKNKSHVIFGKEMRSLFRARQGRVLVGYDASGLEARATAHYVNDPTFTNLILHGDIHTTVMEALGELTTCRDNTKNVVYAYIYGASPSKLGITIDNRPKGMSPSEGGQCVINAIQEILPGLHDLKLRVENSLRKGYLIGLDGRKLYVRKQHAALNTLFQAFGAIAMKTAMVRLHEEVYRKLINSIKVGDFHDEGQHDVHPIDAELFGETAVKAIEWVTDRFNLNVQLTGEYKIGNNWSETH